MSIIFIAVVQTVVVSITDVNPRNAISVVACKQIPEASAALRFTVLWRLIGSIATIVVPIAIPSSRNTPVIGATETVLWTRTLSTVQHIFVRVITTIIVSIAQPVRLHTNVGFLTLQMVLWACRILRTHFMCLIRGVRVLAVVHSIANLCLRNTASIQTSEFPVLARSVGTAFLVRAVLAVVVMIAFPRLKNATPVLASILIGRTRMEGTVVGVLV